MLEPGVAAQRDGLAEHSRPEEFEQLIDAKTREPRHLPMKPERD